MEQRVRILLVDGNEDFRYLLGRRLARSGLLTVEAETGKVADAARLMQELRTEVLLLDPVSAGPRGMEFLRHIRRIEGAERTVLIVLPTVCGETLLRLCQQIGAAMVLPKPLEADVLVEYLESYAVSPARVRALQDEKERALRLRAEVLLLQLRVKPACLGFRMIREALVALGEREYLRGMNKILYREVAARYDTDPRCVERNIRNAISGAWSRMSDQQKQRYFNDAARKAPGNTLFLETLSVWLRRAEEVNL